MAKITVLGAGAFGTAMATVLAANNHEILLWCYEQAVVDQITTTHCNQDFLKGVQLAPSIKATADIQEALNFSSHIFVVVPVKFLRGVVMQMAGYLTPDHTSVMLSKGIEQFTHI